MLTVISAHLDDAVLSAGEVIDGHPGALVVTVLAGCPLLTAENVLTEHDRKTGFRSSYSAVDERRRENRLACSLLRATALDWDFLDSQYGDNDPALIRSALKLLIDRLPPKGTLLIPLGVTHPDHVLVSDLALDAAAMAQYQTAVYEDLPGRVLSPENAQTRLAQLPWPPHDGPAALGAGSFNAKRAAVECYRSQVDETLRRTCFVPERTWRIKW